MFYVTKRFEFDAAHKLNGCVPIDSPCRSLHGHKWFVDVTLSRSILENDMVVNFHVLKHLVGDIVNQFDHTAIVWFNDPAKEILQKMSVSGTRIVETPFETTAENFSKWLYEAIDHRLRRDLPEGISLVSVRVEESPGNSAEYRPEST